MQIPVLRGRVFNDNDTVRPNGYRDVAIVSRQLAERMWPNADPIGKRINCNDDGTGCGEIIGIVGDVKHNSWSTMSVTISTSPAIRVTPSKPTL